MAIVLESLAVPRSSTVPYCSIGRTAPVTSSSALAVSSRVKLPEFAGLKIIKPNATVRSVCRPRLGIARPGSNTIVCEAQETAVVVPEVTDATWKSVVLGSDSPVLVEFWAPWCGPCRMIHPVIDELAKEYAGKLKCYKLNTDQSPSVATEYGIRSIPTIMIFKNGEKKDAIIGAVPKTTLVTNIEKYL